MENFKALEDIWQSAPQPLLPAVQEIIRSAKKAKHDLANKILIQSLILFVAVAGVFAVVTFVNFKLPSTVYAAVALGLLVFIFACIGLGQALFLKNEKLEDAPLKSLEKMERFYKRQLWKNTKGTLIYALVFSLAFAVYFYEMLLPMSWPYRLLIIGSFIVWIVFATTRMAKKQSEAAHEKTRHIIRQLQKAQEILNK